MTIFFSYFWFENIKNVFNLWCFHNLKFNLSLSDFLFIAHSLISIRILFRRINLLYSIWMTISLSCVIRLTATCELYISRFTAQLPFDIKCTKQDYFIKCSPEIEKKKKITIRILLVFTIYGKLYFTNSK